MNGFNSRKRDRQDDFDSSPARNYRRFNEGGGRGRDSPRRGGHPQGPPPISGSQRFKNDFWLMGEALSENPQVASKFLDLNPSSVSRMANVIRDVYARPDLGETVVLDMFATAATELPHKAAYFASLLAVLSVSPIDIRSDNTHGSQPASNPAHPSLPTKPAFPDAEVPYDEQNSSATAIVTDRNEDVEDGANSINIAHMVLGHLFGQLDHFLKAKDWLKVKFIILLLARCCLTAVPSVAVDTLVTILKDLSAALADDDVRGSVKDMVAQILAETVLSLSCTSESNKIDVGTLDDLRQLLKSYKQQRQTWLSEEQRTLLFGSGGFDPLDQLLQTVENSDNSRHADPFVDISCNLPELRTSEVTTSIVYHLPALVVPAESLSAPPRQPTLNILRLFYDETVPATTDVVGLRVRNVIFDIMDTLVAQRRECARVLLELANGLWLNSSLFKRKVDQNGSSNGDVDMNGDSKQSTWVLENIIVECLLSLSLAYPQPPAKSLFYTSLLVELCKLSPTTIAPAMGKCVRKLYSDLDISTSDAPGVVRLDAERIRRFADWFSVHLSNFNFTWRWPEWQGDIGLPNANPKKALMNRLLELETRLSYYDRIKSTLPEPYKEMNIFADEAPLIKFSFEAEDHPQHALADSLLSLIRGRSSIDSVSDEIASVRQKLADDHGLPEEQATVLVNRMTYESILHVGSKSFSHFLNAVERYLSLIKSMTEEPTFRVQLLHTVSSFYHKHQQFIYLAIDKLLRYRIVDPIDVVHWAFSDESVEWHDAASWDILRSSVELAEGRIKLANDRKLSLQQKDADRMADTFDADNAEEPNEELIRAEKQSLALRQELDSVIVEIAKAFAKQASEVDPQSEWWIVGWATDFSRRYGLHLAEVESDLGTILQDPKIGRVFAAGIDFARRYQSIA